MRTLIFAGLWLLWFCAPAAQSRPIDPDQYDCFWLLRESRSERIVCRFSTVMSEAERAEIKKASRGYLDDATCAILINLERALIEQALAATGDHVFEAPPQKATCEITSGETHYPVSLTFAPRVVFKAGVAVEASPQLDNVTGVTRLLWWPVAIWVNRTGMIEEPTLQIVNAYKQRFGTVAP